MRTVTLILLGSLATALAGCSSGKKDQTAVTGTVTYLGKPISGAMVQFVPVGGKGESASARTDASGKYELKNAKGGPGLAPGEYKVVVSKVVDAKGKELPPDASPFSSEGKESLPLIYSSPEETVLKAAVPLNSPATIDLPLTGQGGALSSVPGKR